VVADIRRAVDDHFKSWLGVRAYWAWWGGKDGLVQLRARLEIQKETLNLAVTVINRNIVQDI
jgi:hypothetical protein